MNVSERIAIQASGWLELVNATARTAYRRGWRSAARADVPVISVGNIVMGGSGKTPLVAALADHFLARGHRPAILTRGYRRASKAPVLVLPGTTPRWEDVGDEPALLARTLPGVAIAVDSERSRGAATAVREAGATVLILDDGFQHWRLHRNLDVVVVRAADPLGSVAPRREAPSALRFAHAVVVAGASDRAEAMAATAVVGAYAPDAFVMATRLRGAALHCGSRRLELAELRDRPVLAAAGVGSPDSFVNTLGDMGARIVDLRLFPDHHRYRRREAFELLAAARSGGAWLVMTGKDIVKLPAEVVDDVYWISVVAEPITGSFDQLLCPLGLQSVS
jgi:tetraacyldisaccharide 4'-kinase